MGKKSRGKVTRLEAIVQDLRSAGGPLEGASDNLIGKFEETLSDFSAGKGPVLKFTDHVPPGYEPCIWCCAVPPVGPDLTVKPGYFRDSDVDFGDGRFGVCAHCAGTGVNLHLTYEEREELLGWRFARANLGDAIHSGQWDDRFLGLLLEHRDNIGGFVEQSIAFCASWGTFIRNWQMIVGVMRVADALLFCHDKRHESAIAELALNMGPARRMLSRDEADRMLQQVRVLLAEAREKMLFLLPEDDTADARRLKEAVQPHHTHVEHKVDEAVARMNEPFLFEEFMLLTAVHWHWAAVGQPKGVYAEELVEVLRRWVNPRPPTSIPAEIVAEFLPQKTPDELPGLTPELLAQIHDCAWKFGTDDGEERMRRIAIDEPKEIHVGVSTIPGNLGFSIIGPGGMSIEGTHMIQLLHGIVLWDTRVTVEDMLCFLDIIDGIFDERGAFNRETGDRIRVEDRVAPPLKWEVGRIFAESGMVMAVMPGQDPEAMRQKFDRPDEVTEFKDPFGGTVLCRKQDLPLLEERARMVFAVLRRHGISSPEDLNHLSAEKMLLLRKEIARCEKEGVN